MAVLDKDVLRQKLIDRLSNSEEDSDLELIEDISDTLDSFDGEGENEWKSKYDDIRKRYIERFSKKDEKNADEPEEEEEEEEEDVEETEVTEDDIFEKKEEK